MRILGYATAISLAIGGVALTAIAVRRSRMYGGTGRCGASEAA